MNLDESTDGNILLRCQNDPDRSYSLSSQKIEYLSLLQALSTELNLSEGLELEYVTFDQLTEICEYLKQYDGVITPTSLPKPCKTFAPEKILSPMECACLDLIWARYSVEQICKLLNAANYLGCSCFIEHLAYKMMCELRNTPNSKLAIFLSEHKIKA
jgi:hypothetical protein